MRSLKNLSIVAYTASLFALGSTNAATIFALNDFESGLGVWTANSVSSTGLYIHQTQLQPADDTTTNFAAGGSRAASLGKGGGTITSSLVNLSGGGASETLTIDLDFVWHNGTSTRRAYVEFSADNGTSWYTIAMMQIGAAGASTNKVAYSGAVTLTEGTSSVTRTGNLSAPTSFTGMVTYNGTAFGSSSLVRVRNLASAGADARIFIDNLEVTSTIPEPASLALLGLGSLLIGSGLMRRRS